MSSLYGLAGIIKTFAKAESKATKKSSRSKRAKITSGLFQIASSCRIQVSSAHPPDPKNIRP
jgi:hypothetical protein